MHIATELYLVRSEKDFIAVSILCLSNDYSAYALWCSVVQRRAATGKSSFSFLDAEVSRISLTVANRSTYINPEGLFIFFIKRNQRQLLLYHSRCHRDPVRTRGRDNGDGHW